MNNRGRRCQTLDVANISFATITPIQQLPQKLLWVFSPVLQHGQQEDKEGQLKRQQVKLQPSSPLLLKENDMNHTNQLTNKAKQHAIINMGNRSIKGDCNSRNNKNRTYTEACNSSKSVKNKTIDHEEQNRKSPGNQQMRGGQIPGNTRQGFSSANQKQRMLLTTCPVEQLLNGSKMANHTNNQRQFATLQPPGNLAKGSGVSGSVFLVNKGGGRGSAGGGITASRNTNSGTSTATRLSKRAMRLSDEIAFSQYDHYLNQSLVIEQQQTTETLQIPCSSSTVAVTEGSLSPFLQSTKHRGRFNFVTNQNNKGLRTSNGKINSQQGQYSLPVRSESTRSCSKTPCAGGGSLNNQKIQVKQKNKRDCSSAEALSSSCARGGSATAAAVRVYMNHNNSKIVTLRSPEGQVNSCSPHSFAGQKKHSSKQPIQSQKQKKTNQQQFEQLSIQEQHSLDEIRLRNSSKTWNRVAGVTVASPLLGNKTPLHQGEGNGGNIVASISSKGISTRNTSNTNPSAPQRFAFQLSTTPTQYSHSCKINQAVNTQDNNGQIDKKKLQRALHIPANLPKRPAPLEPSFSVNCHRVHSKSINKSSTNTNTHAQSAAPQSTLNNQSSKSAQGRFSPALGMFHRVMKNNRKNIPSPLGGIEANRHQQREGLCKQRSLSHNDQYPTCIVDTTPLSYLNSSLFMNTISNHQQQQQQQSPQSRVLKRTYLPQTTINQGQKVAQQNSNNNNDKSTSSSDNVDHNISNPKMNTQETRNSTQCLQQGKQCQQQQQQQLVSQYKPIEEYQPLTESKEQQHLKGSISEENLVDDKTQRTQIAQDESVNQNYHNTVSSKRINNIYLEQLMDKEELSMKKKDNNNSNILSKSSNLPQKDIYIFALDQHSKQHFTNSKPHEDSRKSSFYVCCSERARDSAIDFAFSVQNSVKKQGQTIAISNSNNNNSNDTSPHPSLNRFQNMPLNARRHILQQLSSPSLSSSSSPSPSSSSLSSSSSEFNISSSSPCQKMHLLRELQQDNIMLMRLQQPTQHSPVPVHGHFPRGSCPDVSPPPLCKTKMNKDKQNCKNSNIPNKSAQLGMNINSNCCRSALEMRCNKQSRQLIE